MPALAALTRPHGGAWRGASGHTSRLGGDHTSAEPLKLDRTGVETVALAHGALGGTRVLRVEALGVLGVEC